MQINITVKDKIPRVVGDPEIVCVNSDYSILFEFDEEWERFDPKTARFNYERDGEKGYIEQIFTGTTCTIPPLPNISQVEIGVYSGDVRSSRPCKIRCKKSILNGGVHEEPAQDVYLGLLEIAQQVNTQLQQITSDYERVIEQGDQIIQLCNETVTLSNETKAIAQSVRTDADNGVFNPVANYKWVKLTSGVLKSNAMHIYGDKYNGASVPLYGAAMKYKAPARSDGNNYMMYLHLGVMTYNAAGSRQSFDPIVKLGIADGTKKDAERYGSAVIDGCQGLYKLQWNAGDCPPAAYSDSSSLRPGAYSYSLTETNPNCNAARIYIPQMIEAGTEYEIWGLIKEL